MAATSKPIRTPLDVPKPIQKSDRDYGMVPVTGAPNTSIGKPKGS